MTNYNFKSLSNYFQHFINGNFMNFNCSNPKVISLKSPINGNVYGDLHLCQKNNINEIIKTSIKAYKNWKKVLLTERSEILNNVAKVIRENKEKLGYYETLSTGKPISQSIGDVESASEILKYYASLCYDYNKRGESITVNDESYIYTRREPLGVCLGKY